MTRFKTLLIVLITLALVITLTMVAYTSRKSDSQSNLNLKALADSFYNYWTVRELPMAESLAIQKALDEFLNYDDSVHLEFSNRKYKFTLFITYWTPGKMDPRSIHGHTPDVCWVRAGWNLVSGANDYVLTIGDKSTKAGNKRIMEYGGKESLVYFWHLVDGKPYSFHNFSRPPIWAFLNDLWTYGLNLKREQVFCRMSFERGNPEGISENSLNEVFERLEEIGIF